MNLIPRVDCSWPKSRRGWLKLCGLATTLAFFVGWTAYIYANFYRMLDFPWGPWLLGITAALLGWHFLSDSFRQSAKLILLRVTALGVIILTLGVAAFAPRAALVFTGLLLTALALGRTLLRWTNLSPRFSLVERFTYEFALGWSGISLGSACLGAAHLLRYPILLGLVLVGVIAALWPLRLAVIIRQYAHVEIRLMRAGTAVGLMLLCLILLSLHALIMNLAPSVLSDDLVYHWTIAKIFAQQASVNYVPFYSHFNMPFGEEILYATGLLLRGGDQIIGLINQGYAFLLVLAFLVTGSRMGGWAVGAASCLMLFSVPWWIIHLSAGATDLKFVTFTLLAMHAFGRWYQTGDERFSWLNAALIGCSLHYRYQGVISLVFFIGATALLMLTKKAAAGTIAKRMGWLTGLALLVGSFWLVRNWINTGNPFFPTSPRGFNGVYGDPEMSENWRTFGDPASPWYYAIFGFGSSFGSFLRLPWQLTFAGWGFEGYELTPIYLALCPLVFLFRWQTPAVRLCMAFAGFYTIAWFTEVHIVKFLIPAFAMLSLAFAAILYRLTNRTPIGHIVLVAVFVLLPISRSLAYLVVNAKDSWQGALAVDTRKVSRDEYLIAHMPQHEVIAFANQHLPSDAVIFSANDTRLYYLNRRFIYGDPNAQLWIDYRTMPALPDLIGRLQQLGVTHLLCHIPFQCDVHPMLSSTGAAEAIVLKDLDPHYLKLIHSSNGFALYQVQYPADLPPYTGTKTIDLVNVGEILMKYGMLDRARDQFAKAGPAGRIRRLQIDGMTALDRARFYMAKAREYHQAFFIKPSLDAYHLALKAPLDSAEARAIHREAQTARDLANGLAPYTWGRVDLESVYE